MGTKPQAGGTKPQTGKQLPAFEAQTWQGEKLNNSSFSGRRLWIGLYRYASCPLCNLRIHEIIQKWDNLASQGLAKMAVFQATAEDMARYVGKQNPPFPLITDAEEKLYKLFGAQQSWAGFLNPANLVDLARAGAAGFSPGATHGTVSRLPMDILVRRDGTVHTLFRASRIAEHIPMAQVESFLDLDD